MGTGLGLTDVYSEVEATTPERMLWVNVFRVVVLDAMGRPMCTRDRDEAILSARTWLCFGPDLETVATLADFDFEFIRRWAHKQRVNGWPDAYAQPAKLVA